jgi:hypothetical protein
MENHGMGSENCSFIDSNSGGLFIYFFVVSFPVLPIPFPGRDRWVSLYDHLIFVGFFFWEKS